MSRTYKQKILSMYKNGTLDYWENDAPINIQKKWARDNWDLGESKKQKKNKKVKDLNNQLKKDLDE
jgi:hypothetical protein